MSNEPTESDLEKKIEELNALFASQVEVWGFMSSDTKQTHSQQYRLAQQNFHTNGARLLTRLQQVMINMVPITQEEMANADQLRFGDDQCIVTQASSAPITNVESSNEKMQIDDQFETTEPNGCEKSAPKETSKSAKIVTMEQLNEAVRQAEQKNETVFGGFKAITYELHGTLLQEIFEFPQQNEPNVLKMQQAVQAIDKVTNRLKEYGFHVNSMVQRMIILHVVWSLDKHIRECWEYKVGFAEP